MLTVFFFCAIVMAIISIDKSIIIAIAILLKRSIGIAIAITFATSTRFLIGSVFVEGLYFVFYTFYTSYIVFRILYLNLFLGRCISDNFYLVTSCVKHNHAFFKLLF